MFDFLQSLGQNILNGIISVAQWIGNNLSNFFDALKKFITILFAPLILFFQGLWHLLTSLFDIIVLVIQVIFGLFYVVVAIITGVFNTFTQLMGFSGSTNYYVLPSAYQQGFAAVIGFLSQSGINTLAYIIAALIWILTAYAVIRIVGGER